MCATREGAHRLVVSTSCVCILHFAFCITESQRNAQQLIDRVLARVGTNAVTMTDVRAAIELGLVEVKPGEDRQAVALERTIDRQLLLNEVARFSPPEPACRRRSPRKLRR